VKINLLFRQCNQEGAGNELQGKGGCASENTFPFLFQYRAIENVNRTAPAMSRPTSLKVPVRELTKYWCPSSMRDTPRLRTKAKTRLALKRSGKVFIRARNQRTDKMP
jgi:hypothetical protein